MLGGEQMNSRGDWMTFSAGKNHRHARLGEWLRLGLTQLEDAAVAARRNEQAMLMMALGRRAAQPESAVRRSCNASCAARVAIVNINQLAMLRTNRVQRGEFMVGRGKLGAENGDQQEQRNAGGRHAPR